MAWQVSAVHAQQTPGRLARGALFIESGGLLFRILENLKSYGMSPSVLEQQLCLDMYKRFVRLTLPLEVATPKFHLMYHVFLRMGEQGNPIRSLPDLCG